MDEKVFKILEEKGPLTGSGLLQALDCDPLVLWRFCRLSDDITVRFVGTRYLRLDRRVKGYARLSPSLLREFLTYSVIGLSRDDASVDKKAGMVLSHIKEVSRSKSELAYNVVSALVDRVGHETLVKDRACFIMAGDIVFNMAHDVPRPERSTGKTVKGSDMDIVVIVDDRFPGELVKRLDEEIYKEKYRLLLSPYLREEIDYIVKNLNRVRAQMKFDTFKHMVACKIMHEGTLLYGSNEIFHRIKTMLRESRIMDRMAGMEKRAASFRKYAEEYLVSEDPSKIKEDSLNLFYPTEESEEFE